MPRPTGEPRNLCACGCGTKVHGTWAKGHHHRGTGGGFAAGGRIPARPKLAPLPGPDDDLDDPVFGLIEPDPEPDIPEWVNPPPPSEGFPELDMGFEPDELPPDPEPAHLSSVPTRGAPRAGRKTVRVTAGVRKDIEAKLGMMIEIPARVWQARDPVCGGRFVEQKEPIRDALAELVCQSADLVAWFSGVGGGFMLWLNLMAALQPVAVTVYAHHVSHTIADVPVEPPDMSRYAA